MKNNILKFLALAMLIVLSIALGSKELADGEHITPEIGTAASTSAEQISEVEAPKGKILAVIPKDETDLEDRAKKIDQYFEDHGMPLAGYGDEFVAAADRYEIDWRVLAAISVIESTGGKQMCGNNPFGWGSCRSGVGNFATISEAIDYVSMNLGGQNYRTRSAYSGDTMADLWSYNGTVDHLYPDKVMRVMSELMETPLP